MGCRNCGCADCTECMCSMEDSDCFNVFGTGSAADPFYVEANLDPAANNLLECNPSGLGAYLPPEIEDVPCCSVYHTIPQTVPDNTDWPLEFNSELYDTDLMHDISTNNNRISFNTPGVYIVSFNCTWENDPNGDRAAWIRRNGIDRIGLDSKGAGDADLLVGHSVTIHSFFEEDEYVDIIVRQDCGSSLQVQAQPYSPIFSAARVARGPVGS